MQRTLSRLSSLCKRLLPIRLATADRRVEMKVAPGHRQRREPRFEPPPHLGPPKVAQAAYRVDRFVHIFDDEAGSAGLHDLGHRAAVECDDRRAAGHGFYHHEPKWFGPIDGKKKGVGAPEESGFLRFPDLPDELDKRLVADHRLDHLRPIGAVGGVHLGRDLKPLAATPGDFDGAVWPLLGEIRPRNAR